MKNAFILALLCLISSVLSAQNTSAPSLPIESSSFHLIADKYGSVDDAILKMTRDEWAVYRSSELYNEDLVVQVIENQKNTSEKIALREAQKQKRLLPNDNNCACWIEPDETYTEITTSMWTASGGSGPDVDSYLGPLAMGDGLTFDLYGTLFDSLYINSKGSISFGEEVIDWTPEPFPQATHNQITGFWADIDIREQGAIYYKITDEAVFVNFVEVDYFNSIAENHTSRTNTFQITITPQGSAYLGNDNVQLCYLNMNWAHGDSGGNSGFNGPTPGVNGVDVDSETGPSIQIGNFNSNNNNYDGPGQATDGIHWLDNRVFKFDVSGIDPETPPIPLFQEPCDTIIICLNDTFPLILPYLSDQMLSVEDISIETVGSGTYVDTVLIGNISQLEGGFVGSSENIGLNQISITASNNQNPLVNTTINFYFEVIPVELPVLTVSGNIYLCDAEETTLFASEGFDSYTWEHDTCTTAECTASYIFNSSLTAYFMGCAADISFNIPTHSVELLSYLNLPSTPGQGELPCFNDTLMAYISEFAVDDLISFQWTANFNDLGGQIFGPDTLSYVYLSPGVHSIHVEDTLGCLAALAFTIPGTEEFSWELDTNPEIIDSQLGSVEISTFDGTPPFTFDWGAIECFGNSCDDLAAGDYSVVLSDESGCQETINFTIELVTGIIDLQEKNLSIFPNPVQTTLLLNTPGFDSYQVVSANGELALNGVYNGEAIDVSMLASGFYTLVLTSKNATQFQRSRFIKN